MRHRLGNKKLNRTSEHRKALLKNMLNTLVKYEQIMTTLPKAKFLRPEAEKLITIGKKDTFDCIQSTSVIFRIMMTVNGLVKSHCVDANYWKNLQIATLEFTITCLY